MADPAKVRSRAVLPLVGVMRADGVDVDHALGLVGLTTDEIADAEAWVSHERVVRLWQIGAELTGDPNLGLRVSAAIPAGAFGVVEFALRKSDNLLDGFHRASRYFRLGHDVARMNVIDLGERVAFDHVLPGGRTLPRVAADFVLSNALLIARDAVGGDLVPVEVRLDYAEPEDKALLRERFCDNLTFSAGERALVFAATDLERPLQQSEPGLCAILDQHASDLLAKLPTIGSFSDRVRELLAGQLAGGNPTSQEMARVLKMSVRTLHRRLTEEGTSHKQLLEQLRRELAGNYLRDQQIAISEVAYLLGFSEPSAFHRAFRRWTGKTPAAFRESALT